MAEYSTYYNGKHTHVYELDDCLRAIQCRNHDNEQKIKYLEDENRKLKEEYNKDEEIQKMQAEIKKVREDCRRGFPITKEEDKKINEWIEQHNAEVHGFKTVTQRIEAGGCIGGRYSYHFIPTSLGVSGTVRCSCGAEFKFQEIR